MVPIIKESPMIYLDHNATTPIAPDVFEVMRPFLTEAFGNPSSNHTLGRDTRKAVNDAREATAELLGAASLDEIVFTSGGTESNNWALNGAVETQGRSHMIISPVEHEAVRNPCIRLANEGHTLTVLTVDEVGSLDLDELRNSIQRDTAIVSLMHANNETGVIFPVAEIAELVKERSNALFHVDGVNAAGKIRIDLKMTEIDLYSISGHKFNGPKGIGALYIRQGVKIPSRLLGGGQEYRRRAGTEAVHQIAGMGAAARFASDLSDMPRLAQMRDKLEKELLEKVPNSRLNGTSDPSRRLPNTTNLSFENVNGEMIQARLDEKGIYVSTGSACSSIDHKASPVLAAMDVPYSYQMGSIRFSFGRTNRLEEVDHVLATIPSVIEELRKMATGE